MQKKLILMLSVAVISLGLLACGSQNSDTSETMEAAATSIPEAVTDESDKTTEVSEETGNKPEVENTEVVEQEKNMPTWYMDSEGIKSDELGIMIRKDSADWSRFGFSGSLTNSFSDNNATKYVNFNFECNYYEGDLDSYISEQKGMEKGTLENVAYAVREPSETNTVREVAFVGNGIALSITLFDYNIEDIWKNGLNFYEEDNADYLAYIRDETLYCPAIGIKFSGVKDDIVSNRIGISCSNAKYTENSSYEGGYIEIYNENSTFSNGNNAEEKLDDYVNQRVDYGDFAIEETIEKNLGNYKFLGRGCSSEYGSATWLFLSDESTYNITIWYTEEYKLEDYISIIEEIK
ncbi:MAG: hypothetical protein ACI4ED_04245 [Suilimivivens sp.]